MPRLWRFQKSLLNCNLFIPYCANSPQIAIIRSLDENDLNLRTPPFRAVSRPSFCLEGSFVVKPHALKFCREFCSPCNLIGGLQKLLRCGASAHPAYACAGFDVDAGFVVLPVGLFEVAVLENLDVDVILPCALVVPASTIAWKDSRFLILHPDIPSSAYTLTNSQSSRLLM